MNIRKLEVAKIEVYHSEHKMIGLEHFLYVFNASLPELKVYYKDKEIERYTGFKAVEVWQQFNHSEPVLPHLLDNEVYKLCCDIVNRDIKENTRNEFVVFGRSLFFLYFKTFSKYSLARMAELFNQNHATAINGLKVCDYKDEGYLMGWRKQYKSEFEYLVNCKHKKAGIHKLFNIEETH